MGASATPWYVDGDGVPGLLLLQTCARCSIQAHCYRQKGLWHPSRWTLGCGSPHYYGNSTRFGNWIEYGPVRPLQDTKLKYYGPCWPPLRRRTGAKGTRSEGSHSGPSGSATVRHDLRWLGPTTVPEGRTSTGATSPLTSATGTGGPPRPIGTGGPPFHFPSSREVMHSFPGDRYTLLATATFRCTTRGGLVILSRTPSAYQ